MSANGTSVLVIGTEEGCGKTVFMCGLAGALREQGFRTKALKPIVLGSKRASEPELGFITAVTQSRADYPILFIEKPTNILNTNIHNVILTTRQPGTISLVELPGGAASPVSFEMNPVGKLTSNWMDTRDAAMEFDAPCILVAKHQADALERLAVNSFYLQGKGLNVIGLATVEVQPEGGTQLEAKTTRADFTMGLFARTQVHYLGCIKFSRSISVPRITQGNVIKQTESGLDLLLLLKSLNLQMPQPQA